MPVDPPGSPHAEGDSDDEGYSAHLEHATLCPGTKLRCLCRTGLAYRKTPVAEDLDRDAAEVGYGSCVDVLERHEDRHSSVWIRTERGWLPVKTPEGKDAFEVEIPPMQLPLDNHLPNLEAIQDLRVVVRELPDGQGRVEAIHNKELSNSLMTGSFESVTSEGKKVIYEGTFLNDPHHEQPTPHGQGRRMNVDGSTHTGQWKAGLLDGQGEWKAAEEPGKTQETYIGEWKAGKRHGYGVHLFANGDKYEGDWAKGAFQDRGKYTYASGDVFQGIWENGMKKEGSFYFKDGRISRRTWERGVLISCQDFDARKRSYIPTITRGEVHEPHRCTYGGTQVVGMISPSGVRV